MTILPLLLSACLQKEGVVTLGTASTGTSATTGPTETIPGTGATTGTTPATTGTPTSGTTTTGTTGGTSGGTTPPAGPEVLGEATVAGGGDLPPGLVASLVALGFQEADLPEPGDPLAWSAVDADGGFAIVLPAEAPPGDAVELDPKGSPGLMAAFYGPVLHEDPGADGYQEGDPLHGADLGLVVVYLSDPGGKGYPEGWYLLAGLEEGAPVFLEIDADALALVDRTVAPPRELAATLVTDAERLGSVGTAFDAGGDEDLVYDEMVDGAVLEVELADPPAPDVRDEDPDLGMRYAALAHFVYRDRDHSGGFSNGDEVSGDTICYDGQLSYALYLEPPTRLGGMWWVDLLGLVAGWNGLVELGGGEVRVLDDAELLQLEIDPGHCVL